MLNKRNINLDIIRTFAVFTVIAVHFFLNNGFYDTPIYGGKMIIMVYLRNFFMICVPLFLILTGYLMKDKVSSKKYYLNILKVIIVYVVASLFCIGYKYVNCKIMNANDSFSIMYIIKEILSYNGSGYAWYINMYIGLYFLIPYLNMIFKNLKTKENREKFIFILIFTTILPSIINFKYQIIPNYWTNLYPITYYFVGSYISEYKVRIKSWICLIYIVANTALAGSLAIFKSYESKFVGSSLYGHQSLFVFFISILVFLLLLNIKTEKIPNFIKKLIIKISEVSLGMYLVSYIFDKIFYNILNTKVNIMPNRIIYMPIIILSVFICSFILSNVIEIIKKISIKFLRKCNVL